MNSQISSVTLLLFVGGRAESQVETVINAARQAAAQDLLERLLETNRIDRAVIATDDPTWADAIDHLPIEVDIDPAGTPFHFGQRLADLIDRYDVHQALYAGGASAPLMSTQEWQQALDRLQDGDSALVTNNLHSTDWIAFRPARNALPLVAAQTRDNALAWTLAHQGGFLAHALAATAASRFDLDTPADLLVARAHPRIGPHLHKALARLDWPDEPVKKLLDVMAGEGNHLTVIGRSSSTAWAALERNTRCWVRLFVEERGMIASGRLARGEARSILAHYLDEVGATGFFDALAALADGVLFDNRVLMGARGIWPSAADRFNADLLRWKEVEDPFLRAFAHAAAKVDLPMLIGGQSVVAGGLMALLEALEERRNYEP